MGFYNKNTSGTLRECFRLSPTWRTVSFFQSGPSYPAGPSHDEQYYQFCNSFAYNYVMRMRNLTWGYGLRIDVDDDSTREGLLIYSTKSGVTQSKASIHMDGTYRSRNNTYTSYSDIKLKENIVDANSQWDDIKGLKVRNFNFKIDDPSQKMIGVIAQEAETVCPNLVRDIPDTEEKDGEIHETGTHTKEVKYSILYMKAIKCLQ
ncbi:MAG: tail fiber domain-containing protein, partial [Pseudomonadota bacterium]|nr:tail fiber domain-containing protein [Pseudomonadota bacterium]